MIPTSSMLMGVAYFPRGMAFYIKALAIGPLLGSLITEPAAMTLLAITVKRRYFDQGIRPKLAYATLGLLFVNVSIGGTLTHFAAPPAGRGAHEVQGVGELSPADLRR